MTYEEMLETLAAMGAQEREAAIQAHWEAVLSDGFVAYVQGQLEAGRQMAQGGAGLGSVLGTLGSDIAGVLQQQAHQRVAQLAAVWDSMAAVYARLQQQSERQGNTQGMVGHGAHRTMPRGVAVSEAAVCFRCGAPAVGQGLCGGCLGAQQDWEQDDLEYDRSLYERQMDDLDHQRLQDDQLYYDNQQDFNSYDAGYDPGFSTDYSSDY